MTHECVLFSGYIRKDGYGHLFVDGKMVLAHRNSWTKERGAIPAGLFVLHRCDVRACVNPSHLFLGTQKDNMADCSRKGRVRTWQSAKTACPRGHTYDQVVGRKRKIRRCSQCAKAALAKWKAAQ